MIDMIKPVNVERTHSSVRRGESTSEFSLIIHVPECPGHPLYQRAQLPHIRVQPSRFPATGFLTPKDDSVFVESVCSEGHEECR